jgi:dTDP-4-amino-4,6-dideoxygalactose transaminase
VARVTGRTFVPTYQGLRARDLVVSRRRDTRPRYPFDAPRRLSFYRARNAIYHLFRALVAANPTLTVLAPDYYSGNEIMAIAAAGATIRYCPVGPGMQWDPAEVERLCRTYNPDVLYVIHYAGWPQPMVELAELSRRYGMLLVEDCALSLLSESADGRALGSFGDWSVFCLYKTLPLPNGALLVQNSTSPVASAGQARVFESLERLTFRQPGSTSVAGRMAELFLQRLRGRVNSVGASLCAVKRGLGVAAGAMSVERANVGDIGFNLDEVDIAMSPVSARLLERFDFDVIRPRRIANYHQLLAQLPPAAAPAFRELPAGVCPLFFPLLVDDKRAAADALRARGVDVIEFWNDPVGDGREMSAHARFFRRHVLELPIHQDLSSRHIAHIARQVSALRLFFTRRAAAPQVLEVAS